MKVIGLFGPSSCGSTILSAALSQLPGVIAPGEIHWLLDAPFGSVPQAKCGRCGESCPVFTRELFGRATSENLYDLVKLAFGGCDVLVSSDKGWGHFEKLRPLPVLGILPLRHPLHHVAALMPRYEDQAIEIWNNTYISILGRAAVLGVELVKVDMHRFTKDVEAGLKQLSLVTGGLLPLPTSFSSTIPVHHQVGGNATAHESFVIRPETLRRRMVPLNLESEVLKQTSEVWTKLQLLRGV